MAAKRTAAVARARSRRDGGHPPAGRPVRGGGRASAQRGRGQRAQEEGEGVEVILPSLALQREVQHAGAQAQQRERPADAEGRPGGRDETADDEGAQQDQQRPRVGVPGDGPPQRFATEAAVEREHIAHVLVDEGREAAAPREPAEDAGEHGRPARQRRGRAGQRGASAPARGEGARRGAAQPEEARRVRLERQARGERGAPEGERPERARPVPRPRDAQGAGGEEEAQEEIPLARAPRPAREMIEREEDGGGGGARAARPAAGRRRRARRRWPPATGGRTDARRGRPGPAAASSAQCRR